MKQKEMFVVHIRFIKKNLLTVEDEMLWYGANFLWEIIGQTHLINEIMDIFVQKKLF